MGVRRDAIDGSVYALKSSDARDDDVLMALLCTGCVRGRCCREDAMMKGLARAALCKGIAWCRMAMLALVPMGWWKEYVRSA